jgi:glycyl-tRNA synthetase
MNESGKELKYLEPDGNKITPNVIEPSVGIDRLMYAIICDKYDIEKLEGDEEREVLRLSYDLAPYKVAVLPLSNKLSDKAKEVFNKIIDKGISTIFDASGSIGKRYRRQDAIGTPYCITYDFDSEINNTVTIRNRDNMKQDIIKIEDIFSYLNN